MDPIEHHSKAEAPDGIHLARIQSFARDAFQAQARLRAFFLREIAAGIERHPRLRRLRGRWRGWRGRQRRGRRGSSRRGQTLALAHHPLLSRWWPAASIVVLLLMLLTSAVVAVRSVRIVRDHDHWESHAHIMLAQLATLMTNLDEAENGVHTYVITNDTSYLQFYTGAQARLSGELVMLAALTTDDQAQQRRIQALKPLIAATLNDLRTTVTLCQSGQVTQAIALVSAGNDKRALDSIRALIGQIQTAENALLHNRDVNAAGALRWTAYLFGGAVILDLALGVGVVVFMRKSMTLREQVAIEKTRADVQAKLLALEETTTRMSEFMSIASHELRTPLTSAKANVQLIERLLQRTADGQSSLDESQVARLHELAVRAERQMNRQARLVSDLLDLSRIQSGKLEMRPELCDLATIARDAVQEQRTLNGARQIELTLPANVEELPIHADADRIGQVLTNYLTNALKYSPRQSPIEVVVERRGKLAYAAVADAGPGLPPHEVHHIWERFYRADGVEVLAGSGIGLGLGLYISKTIIKRHGGRVGVESKLGQGSLFWLTLPLVSEQALASNSGPTEGSVEAAQHSATTSNGVATNGII